MSTNQEGSSSNMRQMKGIPEADTYVRRNLTFAPISGINGHYAPLLRCIDGRRPAKPDQLGKDDCDHPEGFISFPGGSIGVAALILSAINIKFIERWVKDGDPRADTAREKFSFEKMIQLLERALGGMSGHTDDKAVDDPIACAGCGHAMALLNGGYGLGETYRAQMTEYLKTLKERALKGEEGIVIDVYHGVHSETAVLRLKCTLSFGEFLSIPPTDGDMSVFVFNEHMALEVLRRVTGLVYEELRLDFKEHGISKEEFTTHVESLYYDHVRSSAFKLAHDRPVYDVVHTDKGQVNIHKSDLRY